MKRHLNSCCCIGWSTCTCNGPTWQKSWLCFLEDRCLKWGHSGIRDFFSRASSSPSLVCWLIATTADGRRSLVAFVCEDESSRSITSHRKRRIVKKRREDITSNSRESERDASRRATRAITWFGYTHTANHCVSSFILFCVCVCVSLFFFSQAFRIVQLKHRANRFLYCAVYLFSSPHGNTRCW